MSLILYFCTQTVDGKTDGTDAYDSDSTQISMENKDVPKNRNNYRHQKNNFIHQNGHSSQSGQKGPKKKHNRKAPKMDKKQ